MPLSVGKRLGPYEILAPLGAGGMGEVYRARDAKLGREAALKVLPEAFAQDAGRMARFQREAQLLASLNHPNLAAIYGLEESSSTRALVMELVEGPTLAERIGTVGAGLVPAPSGRPPGAPLRASGGAIPLDEVLQISQQIAEALEYAHERGIIHRDLKPANVKVTPEGTVKILDFGLAKALDLAAASVGGAIHESPLQDSPTISAMATQPGLILGTAAYMSPEQARGKPVDRRADIWAFGCVLYEMLSGRQAFEGETASDTLAAVLKTEPDLSAIPASTPARLRSLLRRCLAKDPKRRLQAIGEARIAIEEILSGVVDGGAGLVPAQARPPGSPRQPWRGALPGVLVVALAAAFAAGLWFEAQRARPEQKWSGTLLAGPGVAIAPRISPDGRTLAFLAFVGGLTQVAVMNPQSADWTVLTKDRSRGAVMDICWSRDGTRIYFDRLLDSPRGIFSVPALGGEERLVLEDAMAPEVLPDGSFLVTRINPERYYQVFRFWPETEKLQPLPALPRFSGVSTSLRAFPDGKEAVFVGRTPDQPKSEPEHHLYMVNLESTHTTRLAPGLSFRAASSEVPLAVDAQGKSVIVGVTSGDLNQLVAVPRNGAAPPRALVSLTLQPWYADLGPDGSLYLDQLDRPLEMLRFPTSGGNPEVLASWPVYANPFAMPLPDGRSILSAIVAGRGRLMIAKPGADPSPFVETHDETRSPLTLVGDHEVAFLAGSPADSSIAIASVSDGRIVRRLKGARGNDVASLASSPDGKTLYYTASGSIWSIPATDGEPRKIGAGDAVAADPNGRGLVVQLIEKEGVRLVRVPVTGGAPQPITVRSDLRLAPAALSPLAVRKDGRIIVTAAVKDSWFWSAAVIDPASGKMEKVPVNFTGDVIGAQWTNDGRISASGFPLRSTLWRFRPENSTGQ